MTVSRLIAALGVALTLTAGSPPAFAQSHTLQHDPFARAVIGAMSGLRSPTPAAPASQRAAPVAPPKLSLNAVLVAGAHSMANVDGVMVRVGESVQGYRLLEVQDRSAVFEKNNAKFTVGLREAKPK